MPKSAMPVLCRALVPEVLPAVMPDLPAVPEVLPAPLPDLVLPSRLPLDLPAEGRAALAAALDGALPAGRRPDRGELVREAVPSRWDDEEIARLRGFLRTVNDLRGRQGRVYPLEYLLALPLIAGMAGDGELDAAAEWAATAPEELLLKLGAPLDTTGKPRRPDATTIGRGLAGCDQGQYDDALCAWSAARARALRPGMRGHLRIDGKAVRGAARGGRAPMLLSGIWDDGTTAAQLPVDVRKTNEIPVFRQLLKKVPDLAGAVITADQMHTQRKHARQIERRGRLLRLHDRGEPAAPVRGGRRPALGVSSRRCLDRRPGPRPHRRPHHQDAAAHAADQGAVPARGAGVPRRALQLRHGRGTARRGRRPRHHQPARRTRPAPLTCLPISAATGQSKCIIMSVMSCLGEDASRIGRAHRAMAAVRNTVAGILHLHQVPNIAAQLRANHRDPYQLPLQFLGLMTPLAPNGNPAVT